MCDSVDPYDDGDDDAFPYTGDVEDVEDMGAVTHGRELIAFGLSDMED